MVNLEGAGIKHPPPMAQDAFERVRLVGLFWDKSPLAKS